MPPITTKPKVAEQDAPAPVASPAVTPKDAVPSAGVDRPVAPNPAPDVSKAITVPAPRNEAQIAADDLITNILTVCESWYATRPQLSTWREPTPDERKVRVMALIQERNVDFTDFMATGAIVQEVDALYNAERAAAGQDKQTAVNKMWGHALIDALTTIKDRVKPIVGITSKRPSVARKPGAIKGKTARVNNNPLFIKWAKDHGMVDEHGEGLFILIDRAAEGMYGTFHATMCRADGKWERLRYNPKDHTYQRTGTLESKPMYWLNPATNEPPAENARKVCCIRMLDRAGKIIETAPHVNNNGTGYDARGDWQVVCRELGLVKTRN